MSKSINIDNVAVGKLLEHLRNNKGMTKQDIAKELNVSLSAVCQWESGKGIKTENIYDLAMFYGITISEIITGELKNENLENYFSRKYNLEKYQSFDHIDETNAESLCDYLKECKSIQDRFYYLVKKHYLDPLSEKEIEEMNYLSNLFEKDYFYAQFGMKEEDPDMAIARIAGNPFLSDAELDYELSKICRLSLKVDSRDILMSGNKNAIKLLFEILPIPTKDLYFSNYLKRYNSYEEIEKDNNVRVMLDCGANCLYLNKSFESINEFDSIGDDYFEGEVVEDKRFNDSIGIISIINENKLEIKPDDRWKLLSLEEYKKLIDLRTTEYLNALTHYKNDKPTKYIAELDKIFLTN